MSHLTLFQIVASELFKNVLVRFVVQRVEQGQPVLQLPERGLGLLLQV